MHLGVVLGLSERGCALDGKIGERCRCAGEQRSIVESWMTLVWQYRKSNQLSGLDEGRGSRRKDAKGDEEHLAVTSYGSLRHTRWQLQPLPVRRTQLLTIVAAVTTVAYRWIECKGGPGGVSCVFTNGEWMEDERGRGTVCILFSCCSSGGGSFDGRGSNT